jgi:glycosyltransferase involved in cell wall biosynthesis
MKQTRVLDPDTSPGPAGSGSGPPAVSIGVPVYNGERFLEESLSSLANQTFTDFEVVISDNASTDATEQICRDFARSDERFKYFRNEVNQGISYNWNRVFELASAPLFKWAAHDDICGVKFLESCVDVLNHDPGVALCYPEGIRIDETGQAWGDPIVNPELSSVDPVERFAALMSDPFWATSIFGVVRRDVLSTTNLLGDHMAHDHVLLAEIALRGRFAVAGGLAFYHRHYPEREDHQSSVKSRARYISSREAALRWPRLKLVGAYLKAIGQSDLSRGQRLRCKTIVARWLIDRTKARIFGEAVGP